jgi:predicted phosphate transport protein (TIGR00153 family)
VFSIAKEYAVQTEVSMFTHKEKEVKELIDEHVEKVGKFKRCLEAFLQGDTATAESVHKGCDDAETEADIVLRKIRDCLYSGAFLPIARKDVYMLTEFVDKIANKAEAVSDVLVYQSPEVPDHYKNPLRVIMETISEMFAIFKEGVALLVPYDSLRVEDKLATIRERIATIGIMESEVDEQEEALMRALFHSDLPLSNKMQLESFLRRITDISDVMEDAADRLYVLVIRERI